MIPDSSPRTPRAGPRVRKTPREHAQGRPMIRSMTGYGFAEGEFQGSRVAVEIRTVNHRGLDVTVRVPRFLTTLEGALRRLIQERLGRGKITAVVSWDGDTDAATELRLNKDAAGRYIALLEALKQEYQLAGEIDLVTVAARPEIL